MNSTHDPGAGSPVADRMVAALRPARLDEMTGEAYRRRRSADLARAFRTPRTAAPARGGRLSRRLLLTGATAAGLAAAVVAVPGLVSTDPPARGPRVTASGPHPPAVRLDAHAVLLAAAETAAREPAAAGRYWYTMERTTRRVDHLVNKRSADDAKPMRPRQAPFAATVSGSQESWTARDPQDRTRTITGIDVSVDFGSSDDEAKWKSMGSPDLRGFPAEPHVNDYDEPIRFMIGQRRLSMDRLAKLPATETGLDKELRRRHQADVDDPKDPLRSTYPQYVWATAQDLLAGPLTPGTRAALYRLLAAQPGLTMVGKVDDGLGRSGIAIAMKTAPGDTEYESDRAPEYRLVVDPDTGRLLAYQVLDGGTEPFLSVAYQTMGWTDGLGERP
ncbi:hypothetical protein Sru01_25860 [Sphaerisporangium rufum]|uniref:CU044_5270 family protein n=1 Tax=Sphaerisporangium rufum TaxID=1381558 RepID=A0A919R0N3_9ACTN|nr:CU044_5270 family protein [Sphaerisporangium rufum]GII77604.1 hypothetical protein Sru01_25860 [Sphaerisporangium rufum]